MDRILIPTDFSDSSFSAVRFAMDAFGPEKTTFILLHTFGEFPKDPLLPEVIMDMEKQARDQMVVFQARCAHLDPSDRIRFETVVGTGTVASVVERTSRERELDAVVLGAIGGGGASRWGSNTEEVVNRCTLPLVVVPADWEPGPIDRILYADDRSLVQDQRTFAALVRIAKRYRSSISMVHVRTHPDEPLPASDLASRGSWFEGIRVEASMLPGDDVTEELARLTDSGHFGLMAVLHRDLGWFDRLFQRSVAKRLALHSRVPLLVLQES